MVRRAVARRRSDRSSTGPPGEWIATVGGRGSVGNAVPGGLAYLAGMDMPNIVVDGWRSFPAGYVAAAIAEIIEPMLTPLPRHAGFPATIRFREATGTNPRVVVRPPGGTEALVEMLWNGTYLVQLAFQAAHETGHVVAGHWEGTYEPGPYHWIEEACCEAFVVLAFERIAAAWPASTDTMRATAQGQFCLDEFRGQSSTVLTEATASQWYRTNAPTVHSVDTAGGYLPLRPAALLLAAAFGADPSLPASLLVRNRNAWTVADEFREGHGALWRGQCRTAGVSEALIDYLDRTFFA